MKYEILRLKTYSVIMLQESVDNIIVHQPYIDPLSYIELALLLELLSFLVLVHVLFITKGRI